MPEALLGHAWSSPVSSGISRARSNTCLPTAAQGCAHPLLTDDGKVLLQPLAAPVLPPEGDGINVG